MKPRSFLGADLPGSDYISDHLKQVVALAWAHSLGATPEDVVASLQRPGGPHRFPIPTDDLPGSDASIATVIRLFNVTFVYGPAWFIEATAETDDEILALETTLLSLGSGRGARSLGETALYYLEEPPELAPSETVAVSTAQGDAKRLERSAPADDVVSAAVSKSGHVFSLVLDQHPEQPVVAAAGLEEWETLIGDITVLVHPRYRRRGLGTYAGSVAAYEAHAAGLVPQWRVPLGNRGARRTADAIGFVLSGTQTTLYLMNRKAGD